MIHPRRRLGFVAGCLCVLTAAGLALTGCATPGATQPSAGLPSVSQSQPDTPASDMPVPAEMDVPAFRALARQEAAGWPQSPLGRVWNTGLVIPSADDMPIGPAQGFTSAGAKEAFGNGNLVYTGTQPSAVPAGVITWDNLAVTAQVPVITLTQAFSELKNNSTGRCPGCQTTPLKVTGAQPDTMLVPSSRGNATIPAWSFTVSGANGRVDVPALPRSSYLLENTVRQPAADLGPLGPAFVGASVANLWGDGGRNLELELSGYPCGAQASWGGLVAETSSVVVVGGWIHDPDPAAVCAAREVGSDVLVRLAAPLGNRVILDAATDLPVAPVPFEGGRVAAR